MAAETPTNQRAELAGLDNLEVLDASPSRRRVPERYGPRPGPCCWRPRSAWPSGNWSTSAGSSTSAARAGYHHPQPLGPAAPRAAVDGLGISLRTLLDWFRAGPGHRHRAGGTGVPDQAVAGRGRVNDHRAADIALDRLGAVRHHPVRHEQRPRPSCSSIMVTRDAVDCERADRRDGLCAAAAAAGGQGHGPAPPGALPAPAAAGHAAGLRGRPQAGLGLCLARPGRGGDRGDHSRPAVARHPAEQRPGPGGYGHARSRSSS